jgi:hypothetical protein
MRMARDHGPAGPAGNYPERHYPDVEPAKVGRGAVLAAGAVVAGGAALAALVARR